MQTRSDDPRVRLLALRSCVEAWTVAGTLLSRMWMTLFVFECPINCIITAFVTDTITFIHECAEDEHDSVAKEARKLKRIIESISGPIGDH